MSVENFLKLIKKSVYPEAWHFKKDASGQWGDSFNAKFLEIK